MNKRILKIDREQRWAHSDEPKCSVTFSGEDAEGDHIRIELKGEDAYEFLRLAQATAAQEKTVTNRLIERLDEMRTLEEAREK